MNLYSVLISLVLPFLLLSVFIFFPVIFSLSSKIYWLCRTPSLLFCFFIPGTAAGLQSTLWFVQIREVKSTRAGSHHGNWWAASGADWRASACGLGILGHVCQKCASWRSGESSGRTQVFVSLPLLAFCVLVNTPAQNVFFVISHRTLPNIVLVLPTIK